MTVCINGVVHPGDVKPVVSACPSAAGAEEYTLTTSADTILVSLYVESVAGDLDVTVFTVGQDGQELEVISFPTVSSPTTELFLKKAAVTLDNILIRTSYTASAKFDIRVKGLSAGELETKILGATDAEAKQKDIPGTATVLIPSALVDRAGLVLKNNSDSDTLYIGFSAAEASTAVGWPLTPGEPLGIDLAAGVSIWAISGGGVIDVRIMEAGG